MSPGQNDPKTRANVLYIQLAHNKSKQPTANSSNTLKLLVWVTSRAIKVAGGVEVGMRLWAGVQDCLELQPSVKNCQRVCAMLH